jgi:putative transposase
VKYQFVLEYNHQFKIKTMCQVLKIARAGYYAWLHEPESGRTIEDKRLLQLIRTSYDASMASTVIVALRWILKN